MLEGLLAERPGTAPLLITLGRLGPATLSSIATAARDPLGGIVGPLRGHLVESRLPKEKLVEEQSPRCKPAGLVRQEVEGLVEVSHHLIPVAKCRVARPALCPELGPIGQ